MTGIFFFGLLTGKRRGIGFLMISQLSRREHTDIDSKR